MPSNDHADREFYAGLLNFALYWNRTFAEEAGMELELPQHGIDVGNFARHSVVRMMITRRDTYHPRYGAPPLYYASCCDGFQVIPPVPYSFTRSRPAILRVARFTVSPRIAWQDVFVADMATYLEW